MLVKVYACLSEMLSPLKVPKSYLLSVFIHSLMRMCVDAEGTCAYLAEEQATGS